MDNTDFLIERLILKAGNTLSNIRIGDLQKYDLTPVQSETILFFSDHSGENIKDLAVHLKVTHQAARKIVDKLKKKEILRSAVSEEDKRATKISLTETGRTLCQSLLQEGTYNGTRLLLGFSDDERTQLLQFLQRIEQNITGDWRKK